MARPPAVPEVEEVVPGLFRIPLPLEGIPLGSVNCYVALSGGRGLVVDPGLDHPLCLEALLAALEALGADRCRLDLFATHFHIDHLSLGARIATPSTRFYFNRPEAEVVPHRLGERWLAAQATMARHGFPEGELEALRALHPANLMPRSFPPFMTVGEGDRIQVGSFSFLVVETPGHSPGHCCLYEERHGLLLSGDHVLEEITPHIGLWDEGTDPLALYLEGLEKVMALRVNLVLPGHGRPFPSLGRRVGEIREHHRRRNLHILRALAEGPLTAYELASRLPWDSPEPFDAFSAIQKYFALSETLAHLRYLEKRGYVKREGGPRGVRFLLEERGLG